MPARIPIRPIGELSVSPKALRNPALFWQLVDFSYTSNSVKQGNSELRFKMATEQNPGLIAVGLEQVGAGPWIRVFAPNTQKIGQLLPGDYKLYFFKPDGTYALEQIAIPDYGLIYRQFRQLVFKTDSISQILNRIPKKKNQETLQELNVKTGLTGYYDLPAYLPAGVISGIVTDADGEPLIGASVLVEGTTVGTVTDLDGTYSLALPEGANQLVFAYTGFNTQKVELERFPRRIDVTMEEGVQLSEVVVTALGGARKINYKKEQAVLALKARATGVLIVENPDKGFEPLSRFITSQEFPSLPRQFEVRKNFRDYAFWAPHLKTDAKGEAEVEVTFPDDLTGWKTFVIGMDDRLRAGLGFGHTNVVKPIIGQLAIPRFLVAGDRAMVVGKSINYLKNPLEVSSKFSINGQALPGNDFTLEDVMIEQSEVLATKIQDSLSVEYSMGTSDYLDGERRTIPIFSMGLSKKEGHFLVLEGDTIVQLPFDASKGPITIKVQQTELDFMQQSVDYLIAYPHGCNEQTASQLLANVLAQKIKQAKGETFKEAYYINSAIRKLDKRQNPDGGWGWWPKGKSSNWITLHVLEALKLADDAGYPSKSLVKGLQSLKDELNDLNPQELLSALNLFAGTNTPLAWEIYFDRLEKSKSSFSIKEHLIFLKLKQDLQIPIDLEEVTSQIKTSTTQGYYFEIPRWSYKEAIEVNLIAYELFQEVGKTNLSNGILRYLISLSNDGYWQNTILTAKILATVLPSMLEDRHLVEEELEYIGNQSEKVSTFPVATQVSAQSMLQFKKKGKGTLFLNVYQEYWLPDPDVRSELFQIETSFQQDKKQVDTLNVGRAAQMIVDLEVKREAEYTLLEIPIPAGCSYGEKEDILRKSEDHREFFKDRVAIYTSRLTLGKHRFIIPLEPRFAGNYTLNPPKVEEMYHPAINGNGELKQVIIHDDD